MTAPAPLLLEILALERPKLPWNHCTLRLMWQVEGRSKVRAFGRHSALWVWELSAGLVLRHTPGMVPGGWLLPPTVRGRADMAGGEEDMEDPIIPSHLPRTVPSHGHSLGP